MMIKLSGELSGYTAKECWLASDAEYAGFERELQRWQRILAAYYDLYVPE